MYKDIDAVIDNTTMQAYYNDKTSLLVSYRITPEPGYKLHHTALDIEVIDEETLEPTGEIELGYTDSFITLNKSYDFEKNIFEVYAVKE